jgi:hypothetical protein
MYPYWRGLISRTGAPCSAGSGSPSSRSAISVPLNASRASTIDR